MVNMPVRVAAILISQCLSLDIAERNVQKLKHRSFSNSGKNIHYVTCLHVILRHNVPKQYHLPLKAAQEVQIYLQHKLNTRTI